MAKGEAGGPTVLARTPRREQPVSGPFPARSRPRLPAAEEGGVHGRDPLLVDPEKGDFRVRDGSPAAKAGAHVVDRELSPQWPLQPDRKSP